MFTEVNRGANESPPVLWFTSGVLTSGKMSFYDRLRFQDSPGMTTYYFEMASDPCLAAVDAPMKPSQTKVQLVYNLLP